MGFSLVSALNEALTAEVQRLKFATAELSGNDASKFQHLSINPNMFQLRQQQMNMHQLQQHQSQQQANGNNTAKNETQQQ